VKQGSAHDRRRTVLLEHGIDLVELSCLDLKCCGSKRFLASHSVRRKGYPQEVSSMAESPLIATTGSTPVVYRVSTGHNLGHWGTVR
jgi:hypothetical protein